MKSYYFYSASNKKLFKPAFLSFFFFFLFSMLPFSSNPTGGSVWSCVDGLGLAVEGATAWVSRWRGRQRQAHGGGVAAWVSQWVSSCLVLTVLALGLWGCRSWGVCDGWRELVAAWGWWRRKGFVVMGASVGLRFEYLGGVVVSA